MCTLAILFRKEAKWPLIIAANRDERLNRPFLKPARHWPEFPEVTAGRDKMAGGTWLACHDNGLFVAMLNRRGSLGPEISKRSRGLLALELAHEGSLSEARHRLDHLDLAIYRPFNMVMGDSESVWWIRWEGERSDQKLQEGLSLLGEGELDDSSIPRMEIYKKKFTVAGWPDRDWDVFSVWQSLLLETAPPGENPRNYLYLEPREGYGTVSSSLIALSPDIDRRWFYRERKNWQEISN